MVLGTVCRRRQPFGWRCVRGAHPLGIPCDNVPAWWNVRARWRWAGQCPL